LSSRQPTKEAGIVTGNADVHSFCLVALATLLLYLLDNIALNPYPISSAGVMARLPDHSGKPAGPEMGSGELRVFVPSPPPITPATTTMLLLQPEEVSIE